MTSAGGSPADQVPDGLTLRVDVGPGSWSDLAEIHMAGRVVRAAFLPGGTVGGRPSIELLIELADGRLVHANTTWRLWSDATELFRRWDVANGGDPDGRD